MQSWDRFLSWQNKTGFSASALPWQSASKEQLSFLIRIVRITVIWRDHYASGLYSILQQKDLFFKRWIIIPLQNFIAGLEKMQFVPCMIIM